MESALLQDGQYTGKVLVKSGIKDGLATITVTKGQIVLIKGSAISFNEGLSSYKQSSDRHTLLKGKILPSRE